jgi:hypothetical protein
MTLPYDFAPPLLMFPETNTTSTAAYAAVAANISGLLALLNTEIDIANKEMNTAMRANLIRSLVTRYSATIAASRSNVAPTIPTKVTRRLIVRDA